MIERAKHRSASELEMEASPGFAVLISQIRDVERSYVDALLSGLYGDVELDSMEAEQRWLLSEAWGEIATSLDGWWPGCRRIMEPH